MRERMRMRESERTRGREKREKEKRERKREKRERKREVLALLIVQCPVGDLIKFTVWPFFLYFIFSTFLLNYLRIVAIATPLGAAHVV